MPVWILRWIANGLKKHWKVVVGIMLVVALYVAYNQHEAGWTAKYTEMQKSHVTELSDIDKARAAERAESEKNIKELQSRLNDLQKQYNDQLLQLEAKKKVVVKQIVNEAKDDPVTLARKLSEVTGFRVDPVVKP